MYASAAIGVDGLYSSRASGHGGIQRSRTRVPLHHGNSAVSGREFTVADNETSLPVAVVNETMMQRFWRGENPVGKRFR